MAHCWLSMSKYQHLTKLTVLWPLRIQILLLRTGSGNCRLIFNLMFGTTGSFLSLLTGEKQLALTKLVDEHPGWSDAQMTDALLAAGAKFGPSKKEALLARFPLKELESILGKIEMGPAHFTFRGNSEPPFYAVMNWSLRFRATKDGKRDEYTVSVEPFEGKVVTFGRRPLTDVAQNP